MSQTTSYLLRVRDHSESYVTSTIEKYYEPLLETVAVNPSTGIILIVATYELPIEAFERIAEIEEVQQIDQPIDASEMDSTSKLRI